MRGIGGWLARRRALAREYWRIRAVEEEARLVVDELERRRDGRGARRVSVVELRRALDEVSDPLGVGPIDVERARRPRGDESPFIAPPLQEIGKREPSLDAAIGAYRELEQEKNRISERDRAILEVLLRVANCRTCRGCQATAREALGVRDSAGNVPLDAHIPRKELLAHYERMASLDKAVGRTPWRPGVAGDEDEQAG